MAVQNTRQGVRNLDALYGYAKPCNKHNALFKALESACGHTDTANNTAWKLHKRTKSVIEHICGLCGKLYRMVRENGVWHPDHSFNNRRNA